MGPHTALYRIDPSQNMSRYYTLCVQPNLFGGFSLMRNWGRIGTGGQMRLELFDTEDNAQEAYDSLISLKLKPGYVVGAVKDSWTVCLNSVR